MNKFKKYLKAYGITIWLVVVVLILASVVYAEYIDDKNHVRRVVANIANEGQLFSSNYLSTGTTELKKASYNAGTGGYCVVPITIGNHSETNPQKAYQNALPYKLEAWLVSDVAGTLIEENAGILTTYPISYSMDGTSFTSFSSLTYNGAKGYYYSNDTLTFDTKDANGNYTVGEHTFYIRFPDTVLNDNPNLYVKVVATPDNTNDFAALSAVMGIQKAGTILSRGWTGGFSDNTAYTDYDAFNYVISGSGEANITFSWCTNYLQVSKINLDQYGWTMGVDITQSDTTINGIYGTWNTLTFTANSDEEDALGNLIGLTRYALQLYMTGDSESDYGSGADTTTGFWATVNKYVSFSAD